VHSFSHLSAAVVGLAVGLALGLTLGLAVGLAVKSQLIPRYPSSHEHFIDPVLDPFTHTP
jgi:hypothetical protein